MSDPALLSWLAEPSPGRGIRFWRGERWDLVTYDELAQLVRRAACGLRDLGVDDEARVAVVLPTGPEFVATFLGALLAGAAPVPIAPSAAFADPAAYRDHVAGILRAAAPAVLVTAPEQLPSLRGTGCRTATFDALLRSGEAPARGPARRPGALGLLQFTSGSSGRPRGVRVPLAALEHNVRAIRDWLGMTAGDAAASWLPVHHDLGLVGCLLTPIASGGDLWLMRPADFVRSPRRYLRCFGSPGARLTAMPSFGLEHVARRIRPEDLAGLDLGEWRALIVGAERLQADVFERFCRVLAPAGFRPAALLPAYGLAEATLAVTGLPLRERWRAVAVRPESLALGSRVALEPSGARVVGCGRALGGVAVAVEDEARRPLPDGHVGEIVVRGGSVAAGYAAGGDLAGPTSFAAGALRTGDAGFLLDGQLFVLGRLGDSLKIRGRSLFAEELESALLGAGIPSRHVAVVLGVRSGVPTGVALLDRGGESWQRQARSLLSRRLEGGDVVVARVPVGSIPRTSSGKPRRRLLWRQFCDGGLATVRPPGGDPSDAGA